MIHVFRFRELNILLDVNSGSVHVVSDIVSDILSFFDMDSANGREAWEAGKTAAIYGATGNYPAEEIYEAVSDIEELIRDDLLFTEEVPEEIANPELREPVIKAMCLHVAHDCNMRCAYCFAGTGEYSGERSLLKEETGKKAIDFLLSHSGNRRNLEIDFFGGEPLMNWGVVEKLVAYGREEEKKYGKNIRFTITTNGLLLDEKKEAYINEHMDNVILSIDGRKEVNDRVRKTPNGAGTYDLIMGNLKRFAEKRSALGKQYFVRGTYTKLNKDFAEDVKHLADLGFANISVEPVVAADGSELAISEADIPTLKEEYNKLADIFLEYEDAGKPFQFFHFNVDLSGGPCLYKRASGCGAGTEYVAVSASGDIYPCHQFVGEEGFLLGNVSDNLFENKLKEQFSNVHIFSKKACRGCWAKYYCSGGCHANAWHENGFFEIPYEIGCKLEKKRLECAVGLLVTR
jgi:uncharacterized protein